MTRYLIPGQALFERREPGEAMPRTAHDCLPGEGCPTGRGRPSKRDPSASLDAIRYTFIA